MVHRNEGEKKRLNTVFPAGSPKTCGSVYDESGHLATRDRGVGSV